MRLRPDGKSSSVCRSLREYLDYYESRGNDWERQMLIKAGFLCGSEKLYDHFTNYIDRFIYPSTHFASPLEQMKRLKRIIEREVADTDNIKLIPGGIRDIEFIVQALQLLNGGKNESLKTGNTINALKKLTEANLLTADEEQHLSKAYILYRKVEHFLQLMNNIQTHTIPSSGEIAEKLSLYLGFKNLNKFREYINQSRERVRVVYNSVVGETKTFSPETKKIEQINFNNQQRALNDFKFLREGKGLTLNRKFDKKSVDAFSQIEKNVLEYLARAYDPDLCLSNFVRVIKKADFPSIWYNEFTDKNFLNIFLILCENSQMVIDLFAEDKILRESFLTRDFLQKIKKKDLPYIRLKALMFKLGSQLCTGLIDNETVSKYLSNAVIQQINESIKTNFEKRNWASDYFIMVLGSTGIQTMSLASDVDLIFVVRNSKKNEAIQKEFQELFGILKKELSPFQVDCRLRPEGESSQLVWDFEKYIEYINNRARIWELQSFLKTRFVCGNKNLFNKLISSFKNRTSRLSKEEVLKGITDVRAKSLSSFPAEMNLIDLKKNPGGLSDIEYIAHYLGLTNASKLKEFIGKSIPEILTNLKGSKKVLNELADNYIFIKKLEIYNQLLFNSSSSKLADDELRYTKLAHMMKLKNGQSLKTKLGSVLKINREHFSKIIFNK